MNVSNLSVGMEVRNYKELCGLLEVHEVRSGGNAKKAHLKELERYFRYTKKGYKFIIEEVYSVPLPPNNNITQYIPMIEQLILHLIINESDHNNRLYIRKSKLLKELKMINENYTNMKYKQLQLSTTNNIPIETIKDFYSSSDDMLKRNIETSLKNLNDRSLILWNHTYSVCEIVDNNYKPITIEMIEKVDEYGDISYKPSINNKLRRIHREASEEEIKAILRIQNDVLELMECETVSEVYQKGLSKEFYTKVNRIMLEKYNIESFYQSYAIVYNIDHVIKRYERSGIFLLEEHEKEILELGLNNEIIKNIVKNGEKRYSKAIELNSNKLHRLDRKYVDDMKVLTDRLIKSK